MSTAPDHTSPYTLPPDLPVPVDDGACDHLVGAALPIGLALPATDGSMVDLSVWTMSPTVIFFYPRSGVPGQPPNLGFHGEEWDSIPGARGCTPQSCGFRDVWGEFKDLGVRVFGVSTQTTEFQREFKERTRLPFELLSDADLRLTRAMRLPTFEFPIESGGPNTMIQRMALYVEGGAIRKLWYPVFPPDRNAAEVLGWLREERERVRSTAGSCVVRAAGAADAEWIRGELRRVWGTTTIRSINRAFEADRLPGFLYERPGGERVGLVTYSLAEHVKPHECEVVTLSVREEGRGIGRALLEAAIDAAREAGRTRVFLTTGNDNLRALGFYQRCGWRIVALHRGIMEEYRRAGWALPKVGMNGIPLHDEIELEMLL